MKRLERLVLPSLLAGWLAASGCAPEPEAAAPQPPADDTATVVVGRASGATVEATSLLGEKLLRPEADEGFARQQEELLAADRADLEARPGDPLAAIWVGRRTAYLGRYREAIDIYTRALEQHPEEARLYRHRGHRYVTVRELDRAVADLSRAAELIVGTEPRAEPDGLPNALNVPLGTTHTAIFYHLGLAHYLRGDFEAAEEAYRECLAYSANDDMVAASSYWLYMILRRLGRDAEAAAVLEPITADMEVVEDHDYHALLLLFRGEKTPEELLGADESLAAATLGYGVGNWYLMEGERDRAVEIFRQVVAGENWAAFGYVAAEAELFRLGDEM